MEPLTHLEIEQKYLFKFSALNNCTRFTVKLSNTAKLEFCIIQQYNERNHNSSEKNILKTLNLISACFPLQPITSGSGHATYLHTRSGSPFL